MRSPRKLDTGGTVPKWCGCTGLDRRVFALPPRHISSSFYTPDRPWSDGPRVRDVVENNRHTGMCSLISWDVDQKSRHFTLILNMEEVFQQHSYSPKFGHFPNLVCDLVL